LNEAKLIWKIKHVATKKLRGNSFDFLGDILVKKIPISITLCTSMQLMTKGVHIGYVF